MNKEIIYLTNEKPVKINGLIGYPFKIKKNGKWVKGLDFDKFDRLKYAGIEYGSAEYIGLVASEFFLKGIKKSLKNAGIKHNNFFRESSLK